MAVATDRAALTGRFPVRPLGRRPSVSVVVPCYRYGHLLPAAVASVLAQPDVEVDVIVVDDASPDDSAAVASALARSDPRVQLIAHASNQGHIATYNDGLARAGGDYVVLLSADDLLTPGALARATALLEAHPTVGFAYGNPLELRGSEPMPVAATTPRDWTVWAGSDWLERRCRTARNCIFCPEVVMRRSVQEAIGGYDPALPHSGDLEMWLRAAAVADVGRVNGADQAYYRIHEQSMQRTVYAGHLRDLEERRAAFASVLIGARRARADGPALYRAACRALAASAVDRACRVLDAGTSAVEPVDDYLAFAVEVDPAVVRTARWRAAQRRRSHGTSTGGRAAAARARLVGRDLADRVRWRRWRRSGV